MLNQILKYPTKSVHLVLNTAQNNSRVLKITKSLIDNKIVDSCIVVAIWDEGLPYIESIDENRTIYRFDTPLSRLRAVGKLRNESYFRKFIAFISLVLLHFKFMYFVCNQKSVSFISCHIVSLLPTSVILKKIKRTLLIYQPHELETETSGLKGFSKIIAKFIEKTFIGSANLVSVVSENIADWYRNEYNIDRPIVIKNAPRLFEQKKTNHFRNDLGIKDYSIIVLYQGVLSAGRGVELLLNCFKNRDDDRVVLVFMGFGELEDQIKVIAKSNNNIFFYPAVKPSTVLEYTSSADLGIHMIQNTCLNHFYCLPNKFFEYAMAGLPIIVSGMKEMRELVVKYNMGIVVTNENLDSMNEAIDQVLTLNLDTIKSNARRCAEENSWEKQEEILIKAIKTLFS